MDQRQINILFLYWGRKGGGAKYSYEIARELSKRNDVNLHLSISNQCEIAGDFRKLDQPTHFVNTYTNFFAYLFRLTIGRFLVRKQLQNYLGENHIDVLIVGMDFFWGPLIYKACKKQGVQSILVVHEPKPHPNEHPLMANVKNLMLKKSIKGAGHVVTLTDHVKRYVNDKYWVKKSNISVIPLGVFSYFKAGEPKQIPDNGDVMILYFGRIEYYKGLDILLEAYKLLEKKRNTIQLEIWGSGDMSVYQNMIFDLENIRVENRWIDESEIRDIFRRAHICVLPYRDASQSGIVGIASDAGLPIVACPADGLKEQLKEAGAVFSEDFTAESLADSIDELLSDPKRFTKISAQSLAYAQSISWTSIASEFKKLAQRLL